VLNFVRQGVIIDTLGEKEASGSSPLSCDLLPDPRLNLTGTIPGLQIASTGLIGQAIISPSSPT